MELIREMLDGLNEFFLWQWGLILDAFIFILSAIPVPAWMVTGSFTLPDGVLWFAAVLELPSGAAIMSSAWILRFTIRRIPFIG